MTTIVTRIGKGSPLSTIEVDANFTNLNTDKAELNSPTFIGTPNAPTAAIGTTNGQIATTLFVANNASSSNPLMDGVVSVGTSTRHARADHVHPTDTSRAPLNSPIFTGTVTIPAGAAISGYATLASPTFTGTVSGITSAMVGLGNVNNTSDAAKPISTATQNALNLKADAANPTFTGTALILNTLTVGGGVNFTNGAIELGSTTAVTSPLVDFHSSGTAVDYDARIMGSGGSSTVGQGNLNFYGVTANFQSMNITTSGDITGLSDARVKRNIVQLKGSLERVLSWTGYSYEMVTDGRKSRGVLAQEIELSAPDLVRKDENGQLSVNYMLMAGDFIEAIRELNTKITVLEKNAKAKGF
jgi:hypothetical protein